MISHTIKAWLNKQKSSHQLSVKIINLNQIPNWKFTKKNIHHVSNRFFKIVGVKILSNFYKKNWDQPIIIQNEIGILGIIKNKKNKKYLLQAKVEPGNINKLQIAPTVQATKSNYNRVHGGLKVPYINYFLKYKKLRRFNQSEQGFRYLYKFNSNILIEIKKKIKKKKEFYWFNKKQIKEMILEKNLINMDTISVFSSFISKLKINNSFNPNKVINNWLKKNDQTYFIKTKIINLGNLKEWSIKLKNIIHKRNKHFSIIGIKVNTSKREINNWSQPILKGKNMAFAGFIKTKIKNTNHYLCRYVLKPGLKKSSIGCTANTSDISIFDNDINLNNEEKIFIKKYFFMKKNKNNIIYDNILSDEGGRFYNCQIRYVITLVDFKDIFNIPKNYMFLSHNQIVELIKKKRLDIESRLLFACDNIDHIK
jgi:oxidase EvaA